MGIIQNSINSMIGSTSRAMMAVKAYQQLKTKRAAQLEKGKQKAAKASQSQQASPQAIAAQQANQSAQNAIDAKRQQRRSFKEYLATQPSSLGPIGKLPESLQNQIAQQYTPHERQKLMNKIDSEGIK